MARIGRIVSITVAIALGCFGATINFDFDGVTAPGCFHFVDPGGPLGPILTDGMLTLDGGVILNGDSGWHGNQTSGENLYGTSDFLPLHDQSLLSGQITGTFSSLVDRLRLDIINGYQEAQFTLKIYDGSGVMVSFISALVGAYPTSSAVSFEMIFPGLIKSFEVSSGQVVGEIDFAIDSLQYETSAAIPEPATFALIGLGLLGLGAVRRYRKA